ncbi:hypothetical protein GCM10027425_20380 [Alteromonas gracilis]
MALAADLWVLLLVLVLTAPMWLAPGHGLARDMVFMPRLPWSWDVVGLGTSLPRAVPLDAVLAAFTSVVDGAVVMRVAVAGTLLLAGCGAHRALRDQPLVMRLVVGGFAVWNPYVVERIALGQWALLTAYAALWWLVPRWVGVLRGEDRRPWALVPLVALAALTPTGGAIVALTAVVVVLASLRAGPRGLALMWVLVPTGLAQLPWLLPALLGGHDATSDPAGVEAFAARAERPGGVLLTLLGTGGVWSRFVVPPSLGTGFGYLVVALCLAGAVTGVLRIRRSLSGLVSAAGLGLLLAALVSWPGGEQVARGLVEHVPGGGLLRDTQKWLAPYVVLVGLGLGVLVDDVLGRVRRAEPSLVAIAATALVTAPLLVMPDAPRATWEALRPVSLPDDARRAVMLLESSPESGAVVTVPYASYRDYPWGNDLSAADPLPRWLDRPVVVSDVLATQSGELAGEDPRAAAVGVALAAPDPASALAELGVGWVWVWRGTGGVTGLDGLEPVQSGPTVRLLRVPGRIAAVDPPSGGVVRGLVAGVDGLWAVAVLAAAGLAARRRRRV